MASVNDPCGRAGSGRVQRALLTRKQMAEATRNAIMYTTSITANARRRGGLLSGDDAPGHRAIQVGRDPISPVIPAMPGATLLHLPEP